MGGKRIVALYAQTVKQDPEYLRNQSRYLHRMYRRNWRFTRWFLLLWSLFFFGRFAVAAADVVGGFGWGFAVRDIWDSLLFLAFGAGMWLFTSLIHAVLLAYVRHTYGREPAED
jgi:hypothetical protein